MYYVIIALLVAPSVAFAAEVEVLSPEQIWTDAPVAIDYSVLEAIFPEASDVTRTLNTQKTYRGTIRLVNRRIDTLHDFTLSNNAVSATYDRFVVSLHHCLDNVDGVHGNDVGFVRVIEVDRGADEPALEVSATTDVSGTELFSGWLYKQYPSVSTFAHPVYSLFLRGCDPV